MKKLSAFVLLAVVLSSVSYAQVNVHGLLCENLSNPLGLDVSIPRFSWQLAAGRRGIMQTAYEIRVGANAASLAKGKGVLWESNKVSSDSSVHVTYKGPALESEKKYFWQVRVWDETGKVSAWSDVAWWQTAFLNASDWKAKWIEAAGEEDPSRPSPLFRREFNTRKKILTATAYITSHGMYEAHINGSRVGNAYLTPGWTSYNKRLEYQVYDVTNLLKGGANAVGVTLGNGWYRGYIGFSGQKNFYGDKLALLFQLDITYTDGTKETVISDDSWKTTTGEIRSSEIYNGETIDARDAKTGWTTTGYDDSKWGAVKTANFDNSILLATYNEPVRKHETFKPIHIFKTPAGEQVIDFGQNLVGWVKIKVNGNAGDKISVWHAEVLDKNGNFYTTNLRAARAEDEYVLKGGGEETFEPHFTFHGFRYIRIEGYPGELAADNFTAEVLYSDMRPTGTFNSSNALINQLQHNIQWGQKGNFLDVPTDCPQRDERLGWTGDAQVFSRTATFNMNVNNFFAKWLKDVAADQMPSGSVPFVIPNVLGPNAGGSTGWADVSTIIPWNMYLAYGDKRILENQYTSMKEWVEYMHKASKSNLWNTGFHFGDWLFYRPDDDNDGRAAVTNKYLIAQCFYAHSTQLLINAATVLGKTDDVNIYTQLLQKIKQAFMNEYVTPNGGLVSGTQTAYVLALNFDMLPENLRRQAAGRLADNVKSYGNHLTTGFLGTPYLCHVLTRYGYTDVAYKLLLQETYPSWLYPVKMGATTIWERWDGIKPDSTFENAGMNSFNHYSYGAIGDWMYRALVGIDTYTDGAGYKHIKVMPHIGEGLTNASASLDTYYGTLSNTWKVDGGTTTMDVEIPANTNATIYLPAAGESTVTESGTALSSVKDIEVTGNENGYVVVKAGSGKYHFEIKK
ncbi:MAG TPA: family 78 glycoside hydrolase catalytic domain [Chitinophagaceae bacterium]|nr:family 78 glycoside hydrolase catalytic domain [Chitinophagaceae bacterium]